VGDGEKLLTHLNSALKFLLGLDIFPRVPKKRLNFVDQCYRPNGQTIKAQYYSSLLVQMKHFWRKAPQEVYKRVLLLHDVPPSHRAHATQKKLAYLGFQYLDHPPYSLDLAPSEYHLFSGLKKKELKFGHFSLDAKVIAAAETWLNGQFSYFFGGVACQS